MPSTKNSQRSLNRGDRLYLFSDGVTEVMNEAEEDFGVERLVGALAEAGPRPLSETLRQVRRSVDHWCGGNLLQDDFTLLGMEVRAQ